MVLPALQVRVPNAANALLQASQIKGARAQTRALQQQVAGRNALIGAFQNNDSSTPAGQAGIVADLSLIDPEKGLQIQQQFAQMSQAEQVQAVKEANIAGGMFSRVTDQASYTQVVNSLEQSGIITAGRFPAEYNPQIVQTAIATAQHTNETAGIKEFNFAQDNPGFAEFNSSRAGGTTVNVGGSGQDFGKPPPGMVFAQNPDGTVATQPFTTPSGQVVQQPIAIPVAGGPVATGAAASEAQAGAQQQQTVTAANVVLEDIGRLRSLVQSAPIPVTGGGSLLSFMPGTNARDAQALVDTIAANVGFDKLQRMREASPTGGALGSVSERENTLLQSVLGNLELSQGQPQFLENLARLERVYNDIIHGPGNAPISPPTIQTQTDFNALPSGSLYISPDTGTLHRKP